MTRLESTKGKEVSKGLDDFIKRKIKDAGKTLWGLADNKEVFHKYDQKETEDLQDDPDVKNDDNLEVDQEHEERVTFNKLVDEAEIEKQENNRRHEMETLNGTIEKWLSDGENIIYECDLEDAESDNAIELFLTNHRVIWIQEASVCSVLLKKIEKYSIYVGYETFGDEGDIGAGNYCIAFSIPDDYAAFWFYSEKVWRHFYEELSKVLIGE